MLTKIILPLLCITLGYLLGTMWIEFIKDIRISHKTRKEEKDNGRDS